MHFASVPTNYVYVNLLSAGQWNAVLVGSTTGVHKFVVKDTRVIRQKDIMPLYKNECALGPENQW